MKALLSAVLFLMVGCTSEQDQGTPLFVVDGMSVYNDSTAPWVPTGLTPERLSTVIHASVDYWGGNVDHVEGIDLTVVDGYSCGDGAGCYEYLQNRIEVSGYIGPYGNCIEGLVIPHEIGHVVLYKLTGDLDPGHTNPKWRGLQKLHESMQQPDCSGEVWRYFAAGGV